MFSRNRLLSLPRSDEITEFTPPLSTKIPKMLSRISKTTAKTTVKTLINPQNLTQTRTFARWVPYKATPIPKLHQNLRTIKNLKSHLENSYLVSPFPCHGISANQFKPLKSPLNNDPSSAKIVVVKNKLVEMALVGTKWEKLGNCMKGMNSLLFVKKEDIVGKVLSEVKGIVKDGKMEFNEFSGAVVDGQLLGHLDLKVLESTPSRVEANGMVLQSVFGCSSTLMAVLEGFGNDETMALKHKSITTPLFRSSTKTPSFSGIISSLKSSLAGPRPINSNLDCQTISRSLIHTTTRKEADDFTPSRSMAFVRGVIDADGMRNNHDFYPQPQLNNEKSDIIHIKLIKNNTFVTITDSKGNKKAGASSGCLEEMKGGGKVSRYAAEATAEHVGRVARTLGLKSVVMRVNGFTHFKKKKQAILSWREGFTLGRGDKSPIAFIEDTTRRPHNGCRLPKKRRV